MLRHDKPAGGSERLAPSIAIIALASLLCVGVWTAPALARTWVVDQSAAGADDAGPGTDEQPFRSIAPAAEQAQPGDTIRVRPGIYRERITPARGGEPGKPITYQAEPGGKVIVRGSDVWSPDWQREDAGIFFASFDSPLFASRNPFLETFWLEPLDDKARDERTLAKLGQGQLFVSGQLYREVLSDDELAAAPRAYRVDRERNGLRVRVSTDTAPAAGTVEVSLRDRLLAPHRRGLGYINVRDFVFEHCANPSGLPHVAAVSPRSGHHWEITGNTIRFVRGIGLEIGSETWKIGQLTDIDEADRKIILAHDHVVANNTITDCGLHAIAGWHHRRTRIVSNILQRNDALDGIGRDGLGAIRLWECDAHVEGNLIRDNHSWGIWMDNNWNNSRITRNVILNNKSGGVFMELCAGPGMIDHNIIGHTRAGGTLGRGYGIYAHDASGITVANNLIFGSDDAAILMRNVSERLTRQSDKTKAIVETSNELIHNNILVGGKMISWPYPNARSHGNASDHNVFAASSDRPFAYNWNQIPADVRRNAETKAGGAPADLSLQQWRDAFGVDENSLVAPGVQVKLDAEELSLSIMIPPAVAAMRCPLVDGTGPDFTGHPAKENPVPPGPFDDLDAPRRTYSLWPIAVCGAKAE